MERTAVVRMGSVARSIVLKHAANAIIADQPKAFAKGDLRLGGHPDLRQKMARIGRKSVVRDYRWECIMQEL